MPAFGCARHAVASYQDYELFDSLYTAPPRFYSDPWTLHHQYPRHHSFVQLLHHDPCTNDSSLRQYKTQADSVGGVAVHLDYRMDEMVHFVTVTSQAMFDLFSSAIHLDDIDMDRSVFKSSPTPESGLRSFVDRLLTCTRLPSSTILLALYYLSKRMTQLSRQRPIRCEKHKFLTVAFMLASKFLDDNTFQNKAWAEISELPAAELNLAEVRWLVDIRWSLLFDQTPKSGFCLWTAHWKKFESQRQDYGAPQLWQDVQNHASDSPISCSTPRFGPIGQSPCHSRTASPGQLTRRSMESRPPSSDARLWWLHAASSSPHQSYWPRSWHLPAELHGQFCQCMVCDRPRTTQELSLRPHGFAVRPMALMAK